jgi:hypothetical protein
MKYLKPSLAVVVLFYQENQPAKSCFFKEVAAALIDSSYKNI